MNQPTFAVSRFENRNGIVSWRVDGRLHGIRFRKNFKTREEAAAEKAVLELKAEQNASGLRSATTCLTNDQVREAESLFRRIVGRTRTLSYYVDYALANYRDPALDVSLADASKEYLAVREAVPTWRATLLELAAPYASNTPTVVAAARASLAARDPLERAAAVRLLAEQPDASATLAPALNDPSRLVRLDAVWALSPTLTEPSPTRAELDAYLALGFFRDHVIPLDRVTNIDELVGNATHDNSTYCLAEPGQLYLAYLPKGGTTTLDLSAASGDFTVSWFKPRDGGPLALVSARSTAALHLHSPPPLPPTSGSPPSATSSHHPADMISLNRRSFPLALLLALASATRAQPALPLDSLAAFRAPAATWQVAGALGGDPRRDATFAALPGTGLLLGTSSASAAPLLTHADYGDLDLDFDFLLGPAADATVYLQGRYAFRLADPTARAPGLWQHLRVEFRAPRFDAAGEKNSPARLVKIVLNGFTVRENLDLPAPTAGAPLAGESPLGPLAFAVTHGSVALRALTPRLPSAPAAAPAKKTAVNKNGKAAKAPPKLVTIPVEVTDTIVMQRGFVPFEPKKRLYATSVGTPAGVHYAYDFETGALLRVWRGRFLDAGEMWEGRSANQWAKSTGPALTLNALPTVAFLPPADTADWPASPDALATSQGYSVEPDGQPVFLSTLATLSIRDRIAPAADRHSLSRTLAFSGALPPGAPAVLLSRARTITAQPGGTGYIIGDREYYLDLPAATTSRAVLRTVGDHQLLLLPVTAATLAEPIIYTLVW